MDSSVYGFLSLVTLCELVLTLWQLRKEERAGTQRRPGASPLDPQHGVPTHSKPGGGEHGTCNVLSH